MSQTAKENKAAGRNLQGLHSHHVETRHHNRSHRSLLSDNISVRPTTVHVLYVCVCVCACVCVRERKREVERERVHVQAHCPSSVTVLKTRSTKGAKAVWQ